MAGIAPGPTTDLLGHLGRYEREGAISRESKAGHEQESGTGTGDRSADEGEKWWATGAGNRLLQGFEAAAEVGVLLLSLLGLLLELVDLLLCHITAQLGVCANVNMDKANLLRTASTSTMLALPSAGTGGGGGGGLAGREHLSGLGADLILLPARRLGLLVVAWAQLIPRRVALRPLLIVLLLLLLVVLVLLLPCLLRLLVVLVVAGAEGARRSFLVKANEPIKSVLGCMSVFVDCDTRVSCKHTELASEPKTFTWAPNQEDGCQYVWLDQSSARIRTSEKTGHAGDGPGGTRTGTGDGRAAATANFLRLVGGGGDGAGLRWVRQARWFFLVTAKPCTLAIIRELGGEVMMACSLLLLSLLLLLLWLWLSWAAAAAAGRDDDDDA